MKVCSWCCVIGVATIFLFLLWRVSNWLWFVPTNQKKRLRDQGLHSSSYKGLFGDIKEMAHTATEAKSKPISPTYDTAPRVSPFFYRSNNAHEFQIGEKVMLKVSSWKGIVRFEKDGKFSPRFLGPFTVLECLGSKTYKLELPPDMHDIHDTFHVGYLYKCLTEQQNVIALHDKRLQNIQISQNASPLSDAHIDDETRYIDEPEAILDTKIKSLRNKQILLVKVRWRHRHGVNVTWEPKEEIQKRYPHMLFQG